MFQKKSSLDNKKSFFLLLFLLLKVDQNPFKRGFKYTQSKKENQECIYWADG